MTEQFGQGTYSCIGTSECTVFTSKLMYIVSIYTTMKWRHLVRPPPKPSFVTPRKYQQRLAQIKIPCIELKFISISTILCIF